MLSFFLSRSHFLSGSGILKYNQENPDKSPLKLFTIYSECAFFRKKNRDLIWCTDARTLFNAVHRLSAPIYDNEFSAKGFFTTLCLLLKS